LSICLFIGALAAIAYAFIAKCESYQSEEGLMLALLQRSLGEGLNKSETFIIHATRAFKAEWLPRLPPALTLRNSVFNPHSISMYFICELFRETASSFNDEW
jgi:hypothetical protein